MIGIGRDSSTLAEGKIHRMFQKEVNAQSPLRILEKSTRGGLGPGKLGVVMADPGVGKTACLVQIALGDLLRGSKVLHIALGSSIDEVRLWYDVLFRDLAELHKLKDREKVYDSITKLRLIQTYPSDTLEATRLNRTAQIFHENLGFTPKCIIVDGYDWHAPRDDTRLAIEALKAIAIRFEAEVWMSACTKRDEHDPRPIEIPPTCAKYLDLIDVALMLEPCGSHVGISLLKDHDHDAPRQDMALKLRCDTMRLEVATPA